MRRVLVAQQQRLGRERGGVLEGRDIGTRVFPETPFKFFLTADPVVRAERRTRELHERGTPEPYEKVLQEMKKRDQDDGSRADSPLTVDDRYTLIDSSGKPIDAVVDEIEGRVRRYHLTGGLPGNIGYCFASQRLMRGDPLSHAG